MMKTRQTLVILLSLGLLFFSSCLKDDPNGSNTTLFYGHQDIPNINYYMPQALLDTLSKTNSIYYKENPPKFLFDSCYNQDTTIVFAFLDQCFGMTSMTFKDNGLEERSSTDNTFSIMNKKWEDYCLNDTLLPIYFDTSFNGTAALDPEVLRHAYIIGDDPYFTLYYYEVREEQLQIQPLNAAILSGKVVYQLFPIDTLQIANNKIVRDSIVNDTIVNDSIIDHPVVHEIVYDSIPYCLTNVKWGVETMKYFPKDTYTQTPPPGEIYIKEFDTLYIQPSKNR